MLVILVGVWLLHEAYFYPQTWPTFRFCLTESY